MYVPWDGWSHEATSDGSPEMDPQRWIPRDGSPEMDPQRWIPRDGLAIEPHRGGVIDTDGLMTIVWDHMGSYWIGLDSPSHVRR